MNNIYLDYAATTPVREEVFQAMKPYFIERYGNPSSSHSLGREARDAVEGARSMCATVLGCQADEVIFTGGGTESVAVATKGAARAQLERGRNTIISSQIEHAAVLTSCEELVPEGMETLYLKVNNEGMVNDSDLSDALSDKVGLVSIILVNNEIGTIQDIHKLSKLAHDNGSIIYTDACQAAGYVDLNVDKLGVDLMSLNASKIYGPKGVGLLYVRRGTPIIPLFSGGGQEYNLRGGTENVPGIVGMSIALKLVNDERGVESERINDLQRYFIDNMIDKNVALVGSANNRISNNINLHFKGCDSTRIVNMLDAAGIYCSVGSACSTTKTEPSHVLMAIGLSYQESFECVRFTLGKDTKKSDIDTTITTLKEIIRSCHG